MANNTPKTMNKQQTYHKRKTEKKVKKRVNSILKRTKKDSKKSFTIDTKDCLRKSKKREYAKYQYWNVFEEDKQKKKE